jgi:hypothetical protein
MVAAIRVAVIALPSVPGPLARQALRCASHGRAAWRGSRRPSGESSRRGVRGRREACSIRARSRRRARPGRPGQDREPSRLDPRTGHAPAIAPCVHRARLAPTCAWQLRRPGNGAIRHGLRLKFEVRYRAPLLARECVDMFDQCRHVRSRGVGGIGGKWSRIHVTKIISTRNIFDTRRRHRMRPYAARQCHAQAASPRSPCAGSSIGDKEAW